MYNIKIYSLDLVYKFTLNPKAVKNDIQFTASLNSWQWQVLLNLDKSFVYSEISNTDIVFIYQNTTLIYQWIIQDVKRIINNNFEEIILPILWIWTLTSYILYRDSWNDTFTKNQDPSQTIKDIIDYINSIYAASFFSYDVSSIETYWTTVSIDFEKESCFSALQKCIEVTNFNLFINNDWKVYFKLKPTIATHRLTVTKDVEQIIVEEDSEKLVNKLVLTHKDWTDIHEDATSQTTYWLKELAISKTDLDQAWADEFWSNYINTYKNPISKTTIILNKNFDFNKIKVLDTIRVNNFKYSIVNLQVVKYWFSRDKLQLFLEDFDSFWTALWSMTAWWTTNSSEPWSWSAWWDITWTLSNQSDLQTALNLKEDNLWFIAENIANKWIANWYAPLDSWNKVPIIHIPDSVIWWVKYQWTWNANTNTPTLSDWSWENWEYYIVSTAWTTTIDWISDWETNDWIISDWTSRNKIDNTDQVTSVNWKKWIVILWIDDLSDVDTTTSTPSIWNIIEFDWTNWVPVTPSSSTFIKCHLWKSATQNLWWANWVITAVNWDSEDRKDTWYTHSTSVNSSRITVDESWRYHIKATVSRTQSWANRTTFQIYWRKNWSTDLLRWMSRSYSRWSVYWDSSNTYNTEVDLVANDYIQIMNKIDDTDATYTANAINAQCELIITKIE